MARYGRPESTILRHDTGERITIRAGIESGYLALHHCPKWLDWDGVSRYFANVVALSGEEESTGFTITRAAFLQLGGRPVKRDGEE